MSLSFGKFKSVNGKLDFLLQVAVWLKIEINGS